MGGGTFCGTILRVNGEIGIHRALTSVTESYRVLCCTALYCTVLYCKTGGECVMSSSHAVP